MKVAAWAILFCALPAGAYERSLNGGGACMWWISHGHSFQIDALGTPDVPGTAAFDAIRRSFATWAAVSCSDLSFPEEPLSTAAGDRRVGYFSAGANHNLVLFRTRACRDVVPAGDACISQGGCSNLYDCWNQGDAVIASTLTTSIRQTGELLDSDIELNDAPTASGPGLRFTAVDGLPCGSDPNQTGCVSIDVQNTVTHEAGHTLGLDHSPDPAATMYASAPAGQVSKRVLATDDIQGVCAIYPRGAASMTCNGPADSGGCGCSATQTGPGAALGMLLLLLQIRRRSRSRPQLAMRRSTAPATAARFHSGSVN
ncbi:MAG: myxosortase-dependent metalloprotease, MXAN_2677/MXAN_2678 family [Myxococcales bacterium]